MGPKNDIIPVKLFKKLSVVNIKKLTLHLMSIILVKRHYISKRKL